MFEKLKEKEKTSESIDFEAKQNLVGFFDLLLKIDKRNHPENYKKQSDENYENNRDTNNTN